MTSYKLIDKDGNIVELFIVEQKGNEVKYERYNDGLRYKLDQPYTPTWKRAKFRLPNGKPKNETYDVKETDENIIAHVCKMYSNYKFTLL